jgi:hypothetical protein
MTSRESLQFDFNIFAEKDTLSLVVAMIGRFFVTYAMNAGVQVF